MATIVHLVDGTYELFRQHFGIPEPQRRDDALAAARQVVRDVLRLLGNGATHVGVATDHVIESFRNDRWPTYKSSAGMPPELLAQFHPLEDALTALGVVVWPMVDLEADDALAAAARVADLDPTVQQVRILTPDKDLAQCVRGQRVVQVHRRTRTVVDEAGVRDRYGIAPGSIPDWLALVGDAADGFPGIPGWGKKSASTVLAVHPHLEDIADDPAGWAVDLRGRDRLAGTLAAGRARALLFRDLATLRADAPVLTGVEELRWSGPAGDLPDMAARLAAPDLVERAERLAGDRQAG